MFILEVSKGPGKGAGEKDNMRVDTSKIETEIAQVCAECGAGWAADEFSNFINSGNKRCDWTRGTWCGDLPGEDDSDEYRMACEQIIDDAASAEWERLWDAREAKAA